MRKAGMEKNLRYFLLCFSKSERQGNDMTPLIGTFNDEDSLKVQIRIHKVSELRAYEIPETKSPLRELRYSKAKHGGFILIISRFETL